MPGIMNNMHWSQPNSFVKDDRAVFTAKAEFKEVSSHNMSYFRRVSTLYML